MSTEVQRPKIVLEEGYSADVVEDRYNPLIKRRELVIIIHHVAKGTPKRYALREAVAKAYGVDVERVYVRKMVTRYGIGRTRAEVNIYDTPERARLFEPEYIIERNQPD